MKDVIDRDRLREFVTTNFYIADRSAFDDSASFLQGGIIDSTGVLELVAFVEAEYGISVTDDEMVPANFDSITAITAFITRKRSSNVGLAR